MADDIANLFCRNTSLGRWLDDTFEAACNDSRVAKQFTFKVVGDLNPFTSLLWVPTTFQDLPGSALNSVFTAFGVDDLSDFGTSNKIMETINSWDDARLPDQDELVDAVYEYLPKWSEIYAVYINSGDLVLANKVYHYYVEQLLNPNGAFAIDVALYALKHYSVDETIDFGEAKTSYTINYNNNGKKSKTGLTKAEMESALAGEQGTDSNKKDCTDKDYKKGNHGCKRASTTYTVEGTKYSCTDSDFASGAHGCTRGQSTWVEKTTFWTVLRDWGHSIENALRKAWSAVVEKLGPIFTEITMEIQDFIRVKFPLTFASERNWTISVTKASTFEKMYEWEYAVSTSMHEEEVETEYVENFSNDKNLNKVNNKSVTNKSVLSGGNLISTTTIYKDSDVNVQQITYYSKMKKKVYTWNEYLNMTKSQEKAYIVEKKRTVVSQDPITGKVKETEVTDKIDFGCRLAYAIEQLNNRGSTNISSSDFSGAYEAIKATLGESHLYSGVYVNYSNLTGGAFGWPLATEAPNPTLTSCTGIRGKVFGSGKEQHTGDDIAVPQGVKILAAKKGRVIINQYMGSGYGYYVVLDHGEGWYTLYGHMVRQSNLSVGTEVDAGQVIGYVGTTGYSSGNHLHFEIRKGSATEKGNTTDFWNADKLEPLHYIDNKTIPQDRVVIYDSACPDRNTWGNAVVN